MSRAELSTVEIDDDFYNACIAGTRFHISQPVTRRTRSKVQLVWAPTGDIFYHKNKTTWPNCGTAVNAIASSIQYQCNIAHLSRERNLPPDEVHSDACSLTFCGPSRANLQRVKKAIYRMIDEGYIEVRNIVMTGTITTP